MTEATFVLPVSLERLDAEVFEGTIVKTVIFADGLLDIGENVFKNAFRLKDVYIPITTKYIADSAFSVNHDLTIHGVIGSYALEWAKKHQVSFMVDDIWCGNNRVERPINDQHSYRGRWLIVDDPYETSIFHDSDQDEYKSMRPQDRPELYPINYKFP